MSKNTRKGSISKFRRIAGIGLLTVLVIGCALLVNQIRDTNRRIATRQMLQSLNPNKGSARAEAVIEPTEAPDEIEAPAQAEETVVTTEDEGDGEAVEASETTEAVEAGSDETAEPGTDEAAPVADEESRDVVVPAPVEVKANDPIGTDEDSEPKDSEPESSEQGSAQVIPAKPAQSAKAATPVAATESESNSGERVFQTDFEELYNINPDLVGWIDVGNYMSMPVVYKDNTFYLDHDYYGNPDNAGTLFINEANTIWDDGDTPADQNLLFHGHNMRDGSIFGDLDDYRQVEYMQKNVIVYFRTIYDYDPIPYVIFAAFDMSATPGESGYFDVGYINFDDDAEFEEYTGSILRRSFYNMPFGVERNDRMLTLLTCSYSNDNGRYVLFCRELHEDETVESVLERAKEITKK